MSETAQADRAYRTYQLGLITLDELIKTLAEVEAEYGAKRITREAMLAARVASES